MKSPTGGQAGSDRRNPRGRRPSSFTGALRRRELPRGTAELGITGGDAEATEADTDAWFTAYAPADRPKTALAVMLVRQGQGGETAGP